jgi:hypothetical protein
VVVSLVDERVVIDFDSPPIRLNEYRIYQKKLHKFTSGSIAVLVDVGPDWLWTGLRTNGDVF